MYTEVRFGEPGDRKERDHWMIVFVGNDEHRALIIAGPELGAAIWLRVEVKIDGSVGGCGAHCVGLQKKVK